MYGKAKLSLLLIQYYDIWSSGGHAFLNFFMLQLLYSCENPVTHSAKVYVDSIASGEEKISISTMNHFSVIIKPSHCTR
jgi:hypothetical protein